MSSKYRKQNTENNSDNEGIERTKKPIIYVSEEDEKPLKQLKKNRKVASDDDEEEQQKPLVVKVSEAVKKEISQRKIASLEHARSIRSNNAVIKKQAKEKDKVALTKLMEQEIKENIKGGIEKRLESKLKKQILNDLKAKKLAELKIKYNYKSDNESSDEENESSEDEQPVIKKKKSVKYVKEVPVKHKKSNESTKNKSEALDLYNKYQF